MPLLVPSRREARSQNVLGPSKMGWGCPGQGPWEGLPLKQREALNKSSDKKKKTLYLHRIKVARLDKEIYRTPSSI